MIHTEVMSAVEEDKRLVEAKTLKLTRELIQRMQMVGMHGQSGAEKIRRLIEREVKRLERKKFAS